MTNINTQTTMEPGLVSCQHYSRHCNYHLQCRCIYICILLGIQILLS